MNEKTSLTKRERQLAALSHASILLGFFTNGLGGALMAAIIWIVERERSAYVRFQALQAVAYQLLGTVAWVLVWCCWLGFYMLTLIPLIFGPARHAEAPPSIFWVGLGSMVIPFAAMGLWVLYGLWGAIRTYQGADFRYLIVGRLVERYLAGLEQQSKENTTGRP